MLSLRFVQWVESLPFAHKRLIWAVSDLLAFCLSTLVALVIFLGIFKVPVQFYAGHLLLSFVLYYAISKHFKVDLRIKRYATIVDFSLLFLIVIFANLISGLILSVMVKWLSFRYLVIVAGLAAVAINGLRIAWQYIYHTKNRCSNTDNSNKENIVLIGAGDGGSLFMSAYQRHPRNEKVVAILDEDHAKIGMNIGGVEVVGGLEQLAVLIEQYNIAKAVIAIPSLKPEKYEEILQYCNELGVRAYNMPKVEDVLLGIHQPKRAMREIKISDLLGRQEIELDESAMRQELEGKTILITGAGGSIGSEIVRQISKHNPAKVILLGHGENSIYLIYHEMIKSHNENMIQYFPVIADIQDYNRLLEIFEEYQPDIIYHAAAHKHVPLMEANPVEAYKNNILGTYNVARAVDDAKVPKMVMISTDKAVNPPNIMGATKRVAELIITGMNKQSESIYCAVRFGNVLGSRGSVVPAFKKQIAAGGPVSVTDFRMIRYFMTIPEASQLVVFAGTFAQDGEVFILDMGEPVKILDLAKKMILLSGHTVEEIGIRESGIRPGEKLYEELLTSSELVENQLNDQIFVGKVVPIPLQETLQFVESLKESIHQPKVMKEKIIKFANDSAQYGG
ncbi:nucleoside-diphosphate sugar epimerase/dehydratase [Facklamia sp. 7083-14-GEN3]|uniref:polysaccharide biosynthesis protein n=1 Tax=Facklamia sp. 7083-14-GEN3 TaxID=2973478 RepID=UPI00215C2581|nr:nucleoside-diphosphate sugar epimerase/dehydratase [Facklamia sp. 7083-14-GEN3]MCR8969578.1 polysaccharide biosynthesis protein [Facklamia sp. 7083-14-GEN3]